MTTDSYGSIGVIDVLDERVAGFKNCFQCKYQSYYCVLQKSRHEPAGLARLRKNDEL
ncbi:hypothetical protein OOJ96_24460 [Pseudomonas sp. 15FMM2]|uniref:Uncharacterized protein n=1 Tax=Pseudomonas imrae TaxID=2992837 RepID=A0ACC7PLP0_9PSED